MGAISHVEEIAMEFVEEDRKMNHNSKQAKPNQMTEKLKEGELENNTASQNVVEEKKFAPNPET